MQKGDHVIVADLSLSLPLRQRPYLVRAHPLGHHDGVVAHVGGIGHSVRLRRLSASVSRQHAPSTTVIDTCCTCDVTTAVAADGQRIGRTPTSSSRVSISAGSAYTRWAPERSSSSRP